MLEVLHSFSADLLADWISVQTFPVWQRGMPYGRHVEETGAGDWFVLAHLGFFFLLLGCFGWAAWSIWRRTTRPEPHMELLMELEAESPASAPVQEKGPPPADPWERPTDWWKQ